MSYAFLTIWLASRWGNVGSPVQLRSPPGPPVKYGVEKKAVRPCGEPSSVIFTPPTLKRLSYLPHAASGISASTLSTSVMKGYATTSMRCAPALAARWMV